MFKNLVHNFFAKLCLTSDFKIKDIKLAQSTRNGLKKRSRLKNKKTFKNEGRRSTLLFFVQRVRNNTKGICMHFSTVEWEEFASFREYKTFYNRLKSFLKIFFTKELDQISCLKFPLCFISPLMLY